MNPQYISIFIGVLSGLLTSAIGLILRSFWINTLKPTFENSIYKDAKIEGKWHGYFVEEYDQKLAETKSWTNEYILEIYRSGHTISGTYIGTTGGDEGRVFELQGSFRNLILSSTFESKNKHCIERGCLNLMLKNNGENLEGLYTNYNDENHEIFSSKIVFKRNNA